MTRQLRSVLLVLALFVGAPSCGSGEDGSPGGGADHGAFNDADIAFATTMMPHHAEALVLVDLTRERKDLGPDLQALAEEILARRVPEINVMTTWLTDWDRPIPETARDHVNADHGDEGHEGGHEAVEGLDELDGLRGAEFEEQWLALMIDHHEAAIEIAQEELEFGKFGPALDLAESIKATQAREIDRMEALVDAA